MSLFPDTRKPLRAGPVDKLAQQLVSILLILPLLDSPIRNTSVPRHTLLLHAFESITEPSIWTGLVRRLLAGSSRGSTSTLSPAITHISPSSCRMMIEMRMQAAQQELAEAQATVSQLHRDLADIQQKSARESESMQAAMHAQADKAQQQLAQVSAGLDEARDESVQVSHTARASSKNLSTCLMSCTGGYAPARKGHIQS